MKLRFEIVVEDVMDQVAGLLKHDEKTGIMAMERVWSRAFMQEGLKPLSVKISVVKEGST